MVTFFFAYLFFSILVAAYANLVKRSGLAWLFLSLIFSPLLAFIALVILGRPWLPALFADLGMKICPQCAEKVKKAAKICRFCGQEFSMEHQVTLDFIVCKKCQGEFSKNFKRCPFCGAPARGILGLLAYSSVKHEESTPPLAKRFETREEYEKWRDEKMDSLKKENRSV